MTAAGRGGAAALVTATVLASVALAGGLIAYEHWSGSARTLGGLRAHRQLVSLGRSALAEASARTRASLARGSTGWLIASGEVGVLTCCPRLTREHARRLDAPGGAARFHVGEVTVTRRRALDLTAGGGSDRSAIIDLAVTVKATRGRASVQLRLVDRCVVTLAPSPLEISLRPSLRAIDAE